MGLTFIKYTNIYTLYVHVLDVCFDKDTTKQGKGIGGNLNNIGQ
jgi:hypothetical protein